MNWENFINKVKFILNPKALDEYKKELLEVYETKLVKKFGKEMKGKLTGLLIKKTVEEIPTIKLESNNLRIDSSSWEKVVNKEGFTEFVNPEGDVWEYKGNQYFTWDAAMREAKKLWKRLPTDEEMKKLEKEDYGEVEYIGFRYTDSSFYYLGVCEEFWTSTEFGTSAWKRSLNLSDTTVHRTIYDKTNGFSLRCIKD